MFPLIPALIFLLLHGPVNFEKLAVSGRLPASLAALQPESAPQETQRQDVSRRALANLIAASGNRALSAAFASMFFDGEPMAPAATEPHKDQTEPKRVVFDDRPPTAPEGFRKFVRSRDGPAHA